jgi:hypothetical protein
MYGGTCTGAAIQNCSFASTSTCLKCTEGFTWNGDSNKCDAETIGSCQVMKGGLCAMCDYSRGMYMPEPSSCVAFGGKLEVGIGLVVILAILAF